MSYIQPPSNNKEGKNKYNYYWGLTQSGGRGWSTSLALITEGCNRLGGVCPCLGTPSPPGSWAQQAHTPGAAGGSVMLKVPKLILWGLWKDSLPDGTRWSLTSLPTPNPRPFCDSMTPQSSTRTWGPRAWAAQPLQCPVPVPQPPLPSGLAILQLGQYNH